MLTHGKISLSLSCSLNISSLFIVSTLGLNYIAQNGPTDGKVTKEGITLQELHTEIVARGVGKGITCVPKCRGLWGCGPSEDLKSSLSEVISGPFSDKTFVLLNLLSIKLSMRQPNNVASFTLSREVYVNNISIVHD